MIRLLLVDDHAMVRAGIRYLLEQAADIQVVGEASNGFEALQVAERLSPQVMLLDMEMPVMSGLEVARRLHASGSPVRILALSAYDDSHYTNEIFAQGISGFLSKDEAPKRILEAIRRVAGEMRARPGETPEAARIAL